MTEKPPGPFQYSEGSQCTTGGFDREHKAAAAFDAAIAHDARFSNVYKEVRGVYTSRNPFEQYDKEPRADRVLVPSRALRDAGWSFGVILVEIKCSGIKIGPVIAQCIDYLRATFDVNGFPMHPGYAFIYPTGMFPGSTGSIMQQHRIGACHSRNGSLGFQIGTRNSLSLEEPHRNFVTRRKVGSR